MANPPHSGALNLANIDLFPTFPPPGGDYVDSSITIMINCDIDLSVDCMQQVGYA